ncbi:MAG: DUF4389 domain-containing protein [Pseudomonas sp.]
MNTFKDNITDPDFWLRLLYTLLFALAWQVIELLLAVILVLQIVFRLFSGKPHADLAGLGNSLSQYAWQIGRYVTGASEVKPWPFLEWPAADAEWQPRPASDPVTVDPQTSTPAAAAPPVSPVAPVPPAGTPRAEADIPAETLPIVEPDAPVVDPAVDQSEPPLVQPVDELDGDQAAEDKPTP